MALIRAVSAFLAISIAVSLSATGILLPLYVYPAAKHRDGATNWKPAFDAIAASPNVPWLMTVETERRTRETVTRTTTRVVSRDIWDWANWEGRRHRRVRDILRRSKGEGDFEFIKTAIAYARRALLLYRFSPSGAVDEKFFEICDVAVVFDGYLNQPNFSQYEGTTSIDANTPDYKYDPKPGRRHGIKLGWLYFCSGGLESITAAPVTVGALAAAFNDSP
ncbi:hypothetical protein E0Z10_g10079 [Xylaria hypoxylon]|uniref:Uncharacterized protein n=1 Tax=Xylaria hypoxylon TaxID=37992 RepID=A0A4Z0YFL3_9PEZI|nr:hypothetical protein E0Z10_g10079 [Xylaria hypoxylon]